MDRNSIHKMRLFEGGTMNRVYKSGVVTILVILCLVVSTVSFSADGSGKSDGKGKLVVASLDVAGPSGDNIYRGDFVTVTARLKSDNAAKPGPLKVRIYLSTDRDGTDMKHEFDVFHDVSLDKSGSASVIKHEFDSFHQVSLDKSGSVSVTGRYVIPYSIEAGNEYYVVVEVSPEEKVIGSGENKTKITRDINIPCDAIPYFDDSTSAKFPAYNFCGERD
jgi:hypothetical protein